MTKSGVAGPSEAVYAGLAAHLGGIAALEQVVRLLGWDQETMMPPRGAAQRAEQCAAVAAATHRLWADPSVGDWVERLQGTALGSAAAVNVAEAQRLHRRATRVPEALAAEIARTTAEAQVVWQAARAANSYADFAPILGRVVTLKRREAECLAGDGVSRYDALLADFEPGISAVEIAGIFDRLRPRLIALRARIAGTKRQAPGFAGHFPQAAQLALAREICGIFGFDWDAGRLDLAVHPSSSGVGGDVRITTRIDEADPRNCLYSTIHELGHARYDQGLDLGQGFLPAGQAASMGVHESQSRLFENQLGRSLAFCGWLYPRLSEAFGDIGLDGPQELWRAVNAVGPGFIRTESDEVHYNLHIMMRFDLERALIAGDLEVSDLAVAWAERFEADFSRAVPDARLGVLQDIHWACGLFGYFPTYSLGNIYAAELHATLVAEMPDLDARLAEGDLAPVVAWLREKVHRHGRLLAPRALIAQATGHDPTEAALAGYLEAKFGALYDL